MQNALVHTPTGATVQFAAPAIRGNAETESLPQRRAWDSDGNPYVYLKSPGPRQQTPLVYTRVASSVVDALLDFYQSRNGNKHSFLWYDHNAVAYTVRFTGEIRRQETGPGRWRVEFTLDADCAPVAIAGLETDWDEVAARKTGITPIWILRSNFDGTTRDYSDVAWIFPAESLDGFTTTIPIVSSWGQIRENISGSIGEILIADLSMTFIVDQDDANNIRHLALQHELETNPVELYLTFAELDPRIVAPRLRFSGNVKDISIPDESQVSITIEDESAKLRKHLGTRITSEAYPLADPDEVGKLIPIIFGAVNKSPGLCVDSGYVSSLSAEMLADATTATVSDAPLSPSTLVNKTLMIEDEDVLITAVAGKVLTIVRAQNSTAAAAHTKGTTVIEKRPAASPIVYLLSDHALDSIGTIYARFRGIDVDITTDCTKKLGTPADQLAAYPGKAAVTIQNLARVANRVLLAVNDALRIVDSNHLHTTGSTASNTTVNPTTALPASGTAYPGTIPGYTPAFYMSMVSVKFPAGSYNTATLKLRISSGTIGWGIILADKADISWSAGAKTSIVYEYNPKVVNLDVTIPLTGTNMTYQYVHLCCKIENTSQYPSTYPNGVGPGYIVTASLDVNMNVAGVATTGSPSGVGRSGAITLSGNSVADIMIGEMLLANCNRASVSTPFQVVNNLLSTYNNDNTLQQVGTLPDFYKLNGAIREYRPTIEWLDYLAFQSKCWFRKSRGVCRLIVRHATPVAPTVISACALNNEGLRAISYKKAPLADVINIINVLYDRDWTATTGKQAESYQHSQQSTDAASVAAYGPLEQPSMFMFDFVTDANMAADLAAFFHDYYAVRKWLVGFQTYLDYATLEFSDEVQLAFANDLTGIIIEAGLQPGDLGTMDNVRFTAAVTHLPPEVADALSTILGDYLVTKDREVIVYV